MNFSPEFFEKLKKAGIKVSKNFNSDLDWKIQKEVEAFVSKAEEAKKNAKKSKLIFGSFNS